MPATLITEELEGAPIHIDEEAAIDALAKRFKVQSAMRVRLGNLLAWG